ncbi:MAG: hypothetical protein MJ071_09230 [Oscillospiraceae bacterium]|nr:hypothetical protein [Oscillospiraceae bacterium]
MRYLKEWSVNHMKKCFSFIAWAVILCSALTSVAYALELYRTKYAPKYLKGDAS